MKKTIRIFAIVAALAVMFVLPSFASSTQIPGNGYMVYDSVFLPEFSYPDGYEYAVICDNGSFDGGFVLYVSETPFQSSNFYVNIDFALSSSFSPSSSSWGSFIDGNEGLSLGEVIWTSHDIGDPALEFIRGSSPISLDGYTIVYWDGNTNGLTEVWDDDQELYHVVFEEEEVNYPFNIFWTTREEYIDGDQITFLYYGGGSGTVSSPIFVDSPYIYINDGNFAFCGSSGEFERFYVSAFAFNGVTPEPTLFENISSIFNSGMTMVADVAETVTTSPLILLAVLIPVIFVSVNLFRRFLKL